MRLESMKKLLLMVSALFVVSCAIHPSNGFYEGREAVEWRHSIPSGAGGVNYYETPSKNSLRLRITFSTTQKGSIYMNISPGSSELEFMGADVVVLFPDGTEKSIKAESPLSLDVGTFDKFKISVPAFRTGGVLFPSLNADFVWNPSTRYYIRGLQ